tara:strand:- start:1090 stop:1386 length:297 start_codon:yes stop_codon:yes gene_type:complete
MMRQFIIYGISDCPACLHACAAALEFYPSSEYIFVNCDFSPSYRETIKNKYNFYTFPIIVARIGDTDELLGGYSELVRFLADDGVECEEVTPSGRDKV